MIGERFAAMDSRFGLQHGLHVPAPFTAEAI